MWKDFLYFSKGQRRAILALILGIVVLQSILWTSNYWIPLLPEEFTNNASIQKDLEAFQDSLSGESRAGSGYADRNRSEYPSEKYSRSGVSETLTTFNPNTVDSISLLALGLKSYIAKNILKYRRKGGVFRKPEDFARIYGITPSQFERLKPYIKIVSDNSAAPGELSEKTMEQFKYRDNGVDKEVKNSKEGVTAISSGESKFSKPAIPDGKSSGVATGALVMDINTADTTVLQQLKGVGTVSANRIARYRNQLGGFYSVRQLEEIKGLYPEVLIRLQSLLKVDTTQIVKINVNKSSLEKLKAHPYLSFYQAKVIVELRKARSGIKNIQELAEFKEFTPVDLNRLHWYLTF